MRPNTFLRQLKFFVEAIHANKEIDFKKLSILLNALPDPDNERIAGQYRNKVLPELIPFFSLLSEYIEQKTESGLDDECVDMKILYIFADYQFQDGLNVLAKAMRKGYKSDDGMWTTILTYKFKMRFQAENLTRLLGDFFPENLIGIGYLQMANRISFEDPLYCPHPFSTVDGVEYLKSLLEKPDPENGAVDAAVAIAFLPESIRKSLIPLALNHPNVYVWLEASWAGTKHGDKECESRLIELAKDYRYAKTAIQYLEELELHEIIPPESLEHQFHGLAEMCSWLSHPCEFGSLPTEISIVDTRTLFWPPVKKEQSVSIVRYRYENWNDQGEYVDVGFIGHVTASFQGLIDVEKMSYEKMYAVYCAWALELKNFSNPEVGLVVLRKYNPGFGE